MQAVLGGGESASGPSIPYRLSATIDPIRSDSIRSGRMAARTRGGLNISTATRLVDGVSHRYCIILQRSDGWE